MKIYNFDRNGFFTGDGDADINPLEPSSYLIPANATTMAPPLFEDKHLARWDGLNWLSVPDFRGQKYWLDDLECEIIDPGVDFPDGAVLEKPASVIALELKKAKEQAAEAANSTYAAMMRELTGGSTSEERDTWPLQLSIAQQVVAGAVLDADDALLADGILKPGETRAAWAAKVVGKNRATKRLIGTANHLLRTTLDAIAAAETAETAEAVQAVLTNAKSQAD